MEGAGGGGEIKVVEIVITSSSKERKMGTFKALLWLKYLERSFVSLSNSIFGNKNDGKMCENLLF